MCKHCKKHIRILLYYKAKKNKEKESFNKKKYDYKNPILYIHYYLHLHQTDHQLQN